MGPPKATPPCTRVYAGLDVVLKGLAAWKLRLRRYPETSPWKSFDPERVMMLTTPPAARPYSAAWVLVMIWNSRPASCEPVERTPLVELSVASARSTLTRLERPRWPLMLSPEVGAAPRLGALSRCTWES